MFNHLSGDLPVKKTILYLIFLIAVTTFTYSNHFKNSFHFDDSHTIENNLFIQSIKNIPLFFKDGTTFSSLPQNQSYRPIVSTSLAIDYWLGNGYNLFYFHLSSFIIFLLQGILMFFLIFKIINDSFKNTWNFYIAAIATTWYMLHPANAETINYIIARSDLQSTFFVVLGFAMYLYSPFCKKYYLYLLPVGIGVLTKPSAVMFAPILFFYVMLFEQNMSIYDVFKKESFNKIIQTIKSTLPAFIFSAIMYKWVDHFTPPTWQSGGTSTFNYLISQPFVIFHYFMTFFLPFSLSADTDWVALQSIWDMKFLLGCLFVFLLILMAVHYSKDKRLRPVTFGIIWFFLALVPTSSVIPFAEVLNDHRIFFPLIGLLISVCWGIGLLLIKLQKQNHHSSIYVKGVFVVSLVLLTGYAYGVHERNKVWKTEESLWKDVTIKSPNNGRGLMNYGLSQMRKGNYREAEKYFTAALKLWPNYPFLYINMGVLKEATGDKVSAENYFKTGIQMGASYPDAWYFYGRYLCNQLRYDEAIPVLSKAIELSSAHINARLLLMKTYEGLGKWNELNDLAQRTLLVIPTNNEALMYLEASKNKTTKQELTISEMEKAPSAEKYLDLSLSYYQAGKYRECIDACEKALMLKPDYADAYSNIGASYIQLKELDKAIEACNNALKINPEHKLAKGNLKWAKEEKAKLNK